MPGKFSAVVTSIDILFRADPPSVTVDFVKNSLLAEEERLKKRCNHHPVRCFHCHELGHIRSKCPKRRLQDLGKANIGSVEEDIAFLGDQMNEQQEIVGSYDSNTNHKRIVKFVVDSGCTNHLLMSGYSNVLINLKEINRKINVAKAGETVTAKYPGCLPMMTNDGRSIALNNVFICENLSYNLLSVRQIEDKGFRVLFENQEVKIMKGDSTILTGSLIGNLYFIELGFYSNEVNIVADSPELWHKRMGHSYRFPVNSLCEICLK
ncbi:hypothetical protein ILUMI_17587, partial [Ignelater luminosus]